MGKSKTPPPQKAAPTKANPRAKPALGGSGRACGVPVRKSTARNGCAAEENPGCRPEGRRYIKGSDLTELGKRRGGTLTLQRVPA
jgi:hypothetical protein